MSATTVDELFSRLQERGEGAYGLADVTQLEHALQSAALAQQKSLGDALVVAALFHDVGHLFVEDDVDLASDGVDDKHEDESAALLSALYGPEVVEPVRLHVVAKRYLCGKHASYFDKLSEDSRRSLALQGGAMSAAEIAEFEAHPHFDAAIELRRIDDMAKIPGRDVPPLSAYRSVAERLAAPAVG